jgi:hypothetical protein
LPRCADCHGGVKLQVSDGQPVGKKSLLITNSEEAPVIRIAEPFRPLAAALLKMQQPTAPLVELSALTSVPSNTNPCPGALPRTVQLDMPPKSKAPVVPGPGAPLMVTGPLARMVIPDLALTVRPLKLNVLLAGNASVPPAGIEFSLVWMAAIVSDESTMIMSPAADAEDGVGVGACAWACCSWEPQPEIGSTGSAVPARSRLRRPTLAFFDSSLKCSPCFWMGNCALIHWPLGPDSSCGRGPRCT